MEKRGENADNMLIGAWRREGVAKEEKSVLGQRTAVGIRQGEDKRVKDSVEGSERKGGANGGIEEQGRDRIAEKMEESQERGKGRIWGITGVKGVQRDERDGSDSGRSGRKFLEERLEVARMERKPEKEVRKWARQEGQDWMERKKEERKVGEGKGRESEGGEGRVKKGED